MASQDPNDITGPAGYGQRHWLQPIPTFAYTIQFENIATATAPAQEVVITQSLDPDLDWTTFELGDLGFDTWTIAVPAGRKSFAVRFKADEALGLFVDIEATFNQHTGVATWRFVAIDPATGDLVSDPSKGFLPPNILPPEGQGFVTYRIRPLPDLPTGRVVQAQASIVFDANAPIVTPRYVNTIDRTPPQAIINELPVSSPLNFTVSWTGSDGNGSGVALYDVYVAQDGGAYSLWQEATPATQAAFTGRSGVTYDFYAIATDHVGLQQPPPESAQASTSIGYRLLLPLITEN